MFLWNHSGTLCDLSDVLVVNECPHAGFLFIFLSSFFVDTEMPQLQGQDGVRLTSSDCRPPARRVLAPRLFHVQHVQAASGGQHLLRPGLAPVLWTALCRSVVPQVFCVWWGKHCADQLYPRCSVWSGKHCADQLYLRGGSYEARARRCLRSTLGTIGQGLVSEVISGVQTPKMFLPKES